ncbi:hypothetical protein [Effusibacillus dendaii]|uniref:Uncharacterized protein n=1 Tax=Effusibacillus dendaii TaxID=2743772 RepID=A0A7I8DK67_9BACL|nr:hypothetical protein [Effusibacillus dendaii]BCJ88301.1 hypothetical protein skT53_32860 [Effusibacillus dendaii]
MFGSMSLFVFTLGPILNLGSIRVLHDMIKDLKLAPVLVAKSNLAGFSTVILWSPYFASVALVLYYLNVPVSHYIPLGLTLAVVQLVIGNLLFGLWFRKKGMLQRGVRSLEAEYQDTALHRKKLRHLGGFLVLLVGLIFLLEHVTKWPMMYLVSLISIFYPVLWLTGKQEWKEAAPHFQDFKISTVRTMNNEIVLFISAGLFGKAMAGTTFAAGIKSFLNLVATASFVYLIVAVIAIILVLTFVGVHQMFCRT